MAKQTTGELQVRDSMRLFTREWLPDDVQTARECKAGILILHGLGEHSGRYNALAEWLTNKGFSVMAFDHRGHGGSGGSRGGLLRQSDFVAHALEILVHYKNLLGQRPFLLGHSLGGAIAASMVIERQAPVSGLILSSPALDPGLGRLQKAMLYLLESWAPDLAINNGLKLNFLSHDPAVIQAYKTDPLVHRKVTAKTVRWLVDTCERLSIPNRPLMPATLLLAAQDDRLVNPAGSESFSRHYAEADLRYHRLDGFYHEIFNESAERRSQVLGILETWLEEQLQVPRTLS
jgi:alpha-beta hydrolase superfamily lysophospholipase